MIAYLILQFGFLILGRTAFENNHNVLAVVFFLMSGVFAFACMGKIAEEREKKRSGK